MLIALAVAGAILLLLVAWLVVRRRPHRALEAAELSAYHDGLDALDRLDAKRAGRS